MFTHKEYKEIVTSVVGNHQKRRTNHGYKSQLDTEHDWISEKHSEVTLLYEGLRYLTEDLDGCEDNKLVTISYGMVKKLHNQMKDYRDVTKTTRNILSEKNRMDGWGSDITGGTE